MLVLLLPGQPFVLWEDVGVSECMSGGGRQTGLGVPVGI